MMFELNYYDMIISHYSVYLGIFVIVASTFIFSDAHAQTGTVGETGYTPNWFLKHEGDSNTLSVISGKSNGGSFPNGTGYIDVVFHGYIGEENATQSVIIKTLYKNVVIRKSSIPVSALDINNGTFIFRPHLILYHPNDTYTLQFSYGNQTVMKQYPYVFGNGGQLIFSTNYMSPAWQFRVGVPANYIVCDIGLQLVITVEDNSPACVYHDTANILIERGWAKEVTPKTGLSYSDKIAVLTTYPRLNSGFALNYTTTGGENEILNATLDKNGTTLYLGLSTYNSGNLTVSLPPGLADLMEGEKRDNPIIILEDNKEIRYSENQSNGYLNLTIPFQRSTTGIEIIEPKL